MPKQRVKTTTRVRVKKNGGKNSKGYRQCNICKGTGIVKTKR